MFIRRINRSTARDFVAQIATVTIGENDPKSAERSMQEYSEGTVSRSARGSIMRYEIEFEREEDGRWIADIAALPGVMAYGSSMTEAESKVEAMALRVIADRIERENTTMTQVRFAVV